MIDISICSASDFMQKKNEKYFAKYDEVEYNKPR